MKRKQIREKTDFLVIFQLSSPQPVYQALALASKAPDLYLANERHGMSMYCVLYEFCCYSRPFNSTVVMPYPYVNYILVEEK